MLKHLVKLKLTLLSLLYFNLQIQAQTGNIVNVNWDGTTYVLNNIYLPSQTSINYGNLGVGFGGGESTYDQLNNRYFIYDTKIYVLDGLSGTFLDSLPRPPGMMNIEYDELFDCLVGGSTQGTFYKIDLVSKVVTTNSLSVLGTMQPYESCFDKINRRYFFRTPTGVVAVDSIGTPLLNFNKNLTAIEYDATLNSIFGILYTPAGSKFYRHNLNTMSGSTLSTLPSYNFTFGQSTYDEFNHHYYVYCSNGALVINALTGATITTLPYYGSGMEHAMLAVLPEPEEPPVEPPGEPVNVQTLAETQQLFVFPNPGDGIFYLGNTKEDMTVTIMDGFGKIILTRKLKDGSDIIDLSDYEAGIYFYQISKDHLLLINSKLVIK